MTHQLLCAADLVCVAALALPAGKLYVDCVGGDDARGGLSPSTALRATAAVNRRAFSPGD